ncbi:MAG: outer membrane protein assembly factor BamD [Victivallales bacterium]|nr:outer membrane protein assembly factor BamD [Victivallales bacterium]
MSGSDEDAAKELEKAAGAVSAGKHRDAGDYYMAARLYADSPDIKRQALQSAAEAYGKAGQKYKQFQCLRDLVAGFPGQVDVPEAISQQYEIGNSFAKGHRDVILSWMPWIKSDNKAIEVYESVLQQAPFADFAPKLKLNLGKMYLAADQFQKALNSFRDVMRQHPDAPEDKFARFELANALVQLSTRGGDGDGMYAREAEEVLRQALEKYPDDPETKWIKQSIQETDAVRSKRLYEIGEFYESRKNPDAAARYFHDLMARYPSSEYADKAVAHLKKLETDYEPPKDIEREAIEYPIGKMQAEPKVILIAPQASGGKWMLPIEDLDLDGKNAEMERDARREAKKEGRRLAKVERDKRVAEERERRRKIEEERAAKGKAGEEKKTDGPPADKPDKRQIKDKSSDTKIEGAQEPDKQAIEALEQKIKEQATREQEDDKASRDKSPDKKKGQELDKTVAAEKKITEPGIPASGEKTIARPEPTKVGKGHMPWISMLVIVLALAAATLYFLKKRSKPGEIRK